MTPPTKQTAMEPIARVLDHITHLEFQLAITVEALKIISFEPVQRLTYPCAHEIAREVLKKLDEKK